MGAGGEWLVNQMQEVLIHGKKAFDACAMELGKMLAETIMYMEREELAGPDYHPRETNLRKWASQPGSVFIGGSKVRVNHPRLRGIEGEAVLRSYQQLKDPTQFSDELLGKVLRGLSGRKYKETILETAGAFGITAGSVSKRVVEATGRQVADLLERDLSLIEVFSIFLDTVHRGGSAFIVALGLDQVGEKHNLGFWEGATEETP